MKSILPSLFHLTLCLTASALDLVPPPVYDEAIDNGTYGYYPTRKYATQTDVRAPETNFVQWSPECDDGLLYFLSPRGYSLPKPGPMILDRRGELVWAHHFENAFGGQAYDFMVQTYKGEEYLTFWLGDDQVRGHGAGFYHMLNSSYDIVHKIGGANGLSADLHEFTILPDGNALMTIYEIVPGDVTMMRNFNPENEKDKDPNYIWDCAFQEVNIETGELVFQWRASEHYNVTESYRGIYNMGTKDVPWDWFHINSMVKDELGNYLISARYTHSITYIDGKTQEIIWQLGGKRNSFMDLSGGDATNFAWQHDARFVETDAFPESYQPSEQVPGFTTKLITLFDNAAEDRNYRWGPQLSRGLLLEVTYPTPGTEKAMSGFVKSPHEKITVQDGATEDEKKLPSINGTDLAYTVRLIQSYENPNNIHSSSQGSMQLLEQGPGRDPKVFLGYGFNAVWTEFQSDGTVLCDVHFAAATSFERGDVQSYRAYKFAWHGFPERPPSAMISDNQIEVLVSWNGATDVAEWVLQSSNSQTAADQDWTTLERVTKFKFETAILIPQTGARYLRVMALTDAGSQLEYGTSRILDRGMIASQFPGVTKNLPKSVTSMSPLRLMFIVACSAAAVFLLYEAYRKYLVWRSGRASGPLMFRKGPFGLLGDV